MNIEKTVLEANGFEAFNPMQKKALKATPYKGSLVVSAPTASGKTVLAELLALDSVLKKRQKVVYTCPLRALASEHFSDFKRKYAKKGAKMALSTGDFDSASRYLSRYDMIFSTNEKVDSLIRHQAEWLKQVGLLIVDEIHELDSDRGPTLEMVITKLRSQNPGLRVLALSATIPNTSELASWLGAKKVESDYRPVPLSEGVYVNGILDFEKTRQDIEDTGDAARALVEDAMKKEKQALVFCNTRRNVQGMADRLATSVHSHLNKKEVRALELLSEKILGALSSPTEQCKRLAKVVKRGAGFHHAGLVGKQRTLIEDAFRAGTIKALAATPTLAAGVNLPAWRVVIASVYRYSGAGMVTIPVREYKQWAGRAGRPRYDSSGESVLIGRGEEEAEELFSTFVHGNIEEVESRLGIEPVLRTHLLALIATHFVRDEKSLHSFFSKTFYAHRYGSPRALEEKLLELLGELHDIKFVEVKEKTFSATKLGRRVSDLYLDPLSAHTLLQGMEKPLDEIGGLFLIANTNELRPYIKAPRAKEGELWQGMHALSNLLPVDVAQEQFFDTELLEKFNTSLLLSAWVSEQSEQDIMDAFNVQPGILYAKLQTCDWVSYAATELARLTGKAKALPALVALRTRLKYGVKEELLPLVALRGIGRVRARRLFRAGQKSISDLKKVNPADLARILGEKTAEQVKKQLKQPFTLSKGARGSTKRPHTGTKKKTHTHTQASLDAF